MADQDWKTRLSDTRNAAQAGAEHLSASAREAVATARNRIGSTYGVARQRADALADSGMDIARTGIEASSRAAAKGIAAAEKAAFSARGLVAERPLTAVAIGVTAGILLGFLANRVVSSGTDEPEPVDDEEIYG